MSQATKLQKDIQETSPVMDCKAAAKYLSVSYFTLRTWAHEGVIPCLMFPATYGNRAMRKLLFSRSDLDEFVRLHRIEGRK